MHDAVTASLRSGQGLYWLDSQLLADLRPDVIVTQSLCSVCAVDLDIVRTAAAALDPPPRIVDTNPMSLQGVIGDVQRLGAELGLEERGRAAAAELQARVDRAVELARELAAAAGPAAKPKRVVFLEWTSPLFPGGHWTPQMIEMAGGVCPVNPPRPGGGAAPSRETDPAEVVAADPDLVIVAPCGLDLATTRREVELLRHLEWWRGLRAVQCGSVALVDGNQHFNRPGPRLVDALEWLVALLAGRPDLMPPAFPWEWLQPEQEWERERGQEQERQPGGEERAAAQAAGDGVETAAAAARGQEPPPATSPPLTSSSTSGTALLAPAAARTSSVASGVAVCAPAAGDRVRAVGTQAAQLWQDGGGGTCDCFSLPGTPRRAAAGPVCEGVVASSCASGASGDVTRVASGTGSAGSSSRGARAAEAPHEAVGGEAAAAANGVAAGAAAAAAGANGTCSGGAGGGCGCGGAALTGSATAVSDPWVPTRSRWSVSPGLPGDIEDLHAATCEAGKGSYHEPSTGYLVFTALSLLKRGSCCGNSCRHCPYGHYKVQGRPRSNTITTPTLLHPKARGGPRPRPQASAPGGAAAADGGVTLLAYEGCPASEQLATEMAAQAAANTGWVASQQRVVLLSAFDVDTDAMWGSGGGDVGAGAAGAAGNACRSLGCALDASLRTGLELVVVPLQVSGRTWHTDPASAREALAYVLRSAAELLKASTISRVVGVQPDCGTPALFDRGAAGSVQDGWAPLVAQAKASS